MISWYKLKNYSSVFLVSEFIWLHKFLGKRIYKLLVKILNKVCMCVYAVPFSFILNVEVWLTVRR